LKRRGDQQSGMAAPHGNSPQAYQTTLSKSREIHSLQSLQNVATGVSRDIARSARVEGLRISSRAVHEPFCRSLCGRVRLAGQPAVTSLMVSKTEQTAGAVVRCYWGVRWGSGRVVPLLRGGESPAAAEIVYFSSSYGNGNGSRNFPQLQRQGGKFRANTRRYARKITGGLN